jgi:hypothetical protein
MASHIHSSTYMSHSPRPGGPHVESWLRLARRKHGSDSSSKVRWVTPQASAMCTLVSFQSDYSRADISSFMMSCCLPGSRGLPEKGMGVPEGDLAMWGWVRDVSPLEGSWLHSAMVDQGMISAILTTVGVNKTMTKGPHQWGFSDWTFHSFTQTASPGL